MIEQAKALFEAEEYDECLRLCNSILYDEPENPQVLFLVGHIMIKAERWGLAYNLYKRVTELAPHVMEGWNNLAHCAQEMGRFDEAQRILEICLRMRPNDFAPLNNLLLQEANQCRPWKALYWAKKAARVAKTEQEIRDLKTNSALAYLALGKWKEGWECYEYNLPGKFRRERQYASEGRWDGTPGQTVVIYGEQGIGDEVMFASMIPDAMRDANVIIECDHRLEGLFRRSFPVPVYGTRYGEPWWIWDHRIDARCAMGSLGRFYRSNGEFPRTPYLIADPERRLQWRALLDTLPGKKIGLAWTGGRQNTRAKERSVSLEQLRPLLETGHTFVSLQYRDAPEAADYGVHHWKRATQTDDYDDTAALVAELDAIVSVTTAVALLAGALGKECHVLIPEQPTWHWGIDGDMPWFPLRCYRKKGTSWTPLVEKIAEAISGA